MGLIKEGIFASVTTDEERLIGRAQQGDTAAFEVLMNRHAPYVYNLALRTVGDPQEAEDMAQETFIRAWRTLPQFRRQAQFTTWLYRIVVNLCYNRLPGLKGELAALDPAEAEHLSDERPRVEELVVTAEMQRLIHAALEALPESYRLLLTLRHLQEMSYAEIAETMQMPLGTVKTGIFRGRALLREALEDGNDE
jgi:RNA polymerase sigma-70 factor (ECF subfamily)